MQTHIMTPIQHLFSAFTWHLLSVPVPTGMEELGLDNARQVLESMDLNADTEEGFRELGNFLDQLQEGLTTSYLTSNTDIALLVFPSNQALSLFCCMLTI